MQGASRGERSVSLTGIYGIWYLEVLSLAPLQSINQQSAQ
jgi:hypothetical protein